MGTIVFFLEEASAREFLNGFLPRVLPGGLSFRCIAFEGKQDLESQLERKLRGWRTPDTKFVVLRDMDSSNCVTTKKNLLAKCTNAGRPDVLIRIACREIESWYLGDLDALGRTFNSQRILSKKSKAKYRNPDNIGNPVQEIRALTNQHYQKISGSRQLGPELSIDDNRSHSFGVFVAGLKRLLDN
jgi:hypothetical protein